MHLWMIWGEPSRAHNFQPLRQLPSICAVGWIHLYDEPPTSAGGLIAANGAEKPGYFAWKSG